MSRAAPAGDFDYERNGSGYSAQRRPDDRYVAAVEPSAAMRGAAPPDRVPAIDATDERLPFDDDSFDAAMATVTIHQWSDLDTGLREMRRVSRGVVAILASTTQRWRTSGCATTGLRSSQLTSSDSR